MSETEKQEIFDQGYNSYLKGVDVWENPYNDTTEYNKWKQWFDGFSLANKETKEG